MHIDDRNVLCAALNSLLDDTETSDVQPFTGIYCHRLFCAWSRKRCSRLNERRELGSFGHEDADIEYVRIMLSYIQMLAISSSIMPLMANRFEIVEGMEYLIQTVNVKGTLHWGSTFNER